MVIPPFDMNSLFGALPCPMCHDRGTVFMVSGTVSSKSDQALQEELVRHKLYGEYLEPKDTE